MSNAKAEIRQATRQNSQRTLRQEAEQWTFVVYNPSETALRTIGPEWCRVQRSDSRRSHQPDLRQNLRHRPNENDDQSDNINFRGKFDG